MNDQEEQEDFHAFAMRRYDEEGGAVVRRVQEYLDKQWEAIGLQIANEWLDKHPGPIDPEQIASVILALSGKSKELVEKYSKQ